MPRLRLSETDLNAAVLRNHFEHVPMAEAKVKVALILHFYFVSKFTVTDFCLRVETFTSYICFTVISR